MLENVVKKTILTGQKKTTGDINRRKSQYVFDKRFDRQRTGLQGEPRRL